jgi:hypothetical protein
VWRSPGPTEDADVAADADGTLPPVDDFAPPSTATPVHRVLLLVVHRRNSELLTDWFADRSTYDAVDGTGVLADERATAATSESTEGVPVDWRRP